MTASYVCMILILGFSSHACWKTTKVAWVFPSILDGCVGYIRPVCKCKFEILLFMTDA